MLMRKSGPRSSRDMSKQVDATGMAVRDSVPEEASFLESNISEYEGRRSTVSVNARDTSQKGRQF